MGYLIRKSLLISALILLPAVLSANTTPTELFHGLSEEDSNFKSYRPSYFGFRQGHSDSGNEGEVKFQLSLKYQLTENEELESYPLINDVIKNWYFGYTQKSFWSIQESSQPFRESNYAPEFFKEMKFSSLNDDRALKTIRLGLFRHESTGEAGPGSRGWNITYIEPIYKFGDFSAAFKLWVPAFFREESDVAPDNPDIFDFYGHGEIRFFYKQSDTFQHSMMYRQGDNSDLYGFRWQTDIALTIEDWTPKIFIQYWSGYGESLKDYNNKTDGVVIGFSAVN